MSFDGRVCACMLSNLQLNLFSASLNYINVVIVKHKMHATTFLDLNPLKSLNDLLHIEKSFLFLKMVTLR